MNAYVDSTRGPSLKAVARIEEKAAAIQGVIKTLRSLFSRVQLHIDFVSTTPGDATIALEGDVSEKTWKTCMDKLGFVYKGDHYELPDFSGVGVFYKGESTVSVKLL